MGTSKSNIRIPASRKNILKNVINATDTSGTISTNKPKRSESTRISIEDYDNAEQFYINDENSDTKSNSTKNKFDWLNFISNNLAAILTVLGVIVATTIYLTRLDTKVDALIGDVKDVKNTVEKLSTESAKIGLEVVHIQRSIERIDINNNKK